MRLLLAVLLHQASNPLAIDNTNWFLVVITAILAAITGYYAWQTKKSVVALEESTKAQFKPFLKGSIAQIGPDSLQLQITNIGKGSAEEITVTLTPENSRAPKEHGQVNYYNLTNTKDSLYLSVQTLIWSKGVLVSLETTKQQ